MYQTAALFLLPLALGSEPAERNELVNLRIAQVESSESAELDRLPSTGEAPIEERPIEGRPNGARPIESRHPISLHNSLRPGFTGPFPEEIIAQELGLPLFMQPNPWLTERPGPCSVCRYKTGYWCKWWHSPCDMFPHTPYYPTLNGYYYFRPYHIAHVKHHQEVVKTWGGDPRHPYANEIFDEVYKQVRAELIESGEIKPNPERLPEAEGDVPLPPPVGEVPPSPDGTSPSDLRLRD